LTKLDIDVIPTTMYTVNSSNIRLSVE